MRTFKLPGLIGDVTSSIIRFELATSEEDLIIRTEESFLTGFFSTSLYLLAPGWEGYVGTTLPACELEVEGSPKFLSLDSNKDFCNVTVYSRSSSRLCAKFSSRGMENYSTCIKIYGASCYSNNLPPNYCNNLPRVHKMRLGQCFLFAVPPITLHDELRFSNGIIVASNLKSRIDNDVSDDKLPFLIARLHLQHVGLANHLPNHSMQSDDRKLDL
ncbi:unnamed protein product [Acanthoscelides obtectus]|uniref:Uncharacterized protein n=1 Tax=Acanthoscelides obtectus TaxID=200917 RepID=A0A9P0KNN4_ACAOB|nr:unnamed protein product [Acanthoscelides obtectus]CAK1625703.1 hypothetical protein AOBTE_LOCUS3346 [Acanthoscelides obtectus]